MIFFFEKCCIYQRKAVPLYRNQRDDCKGDSENLEKSRKNEKPKAL